MFSFIWSLSLVRRINFSTPDLVASLLAASLAISPKIPKRSLGLFKVIPSLITSRVVHKSPLAAKRVVLEARRTAVKRELAIASLSASATT